MVIQSKTGSALLIIFAVIGAIAALGVLAMFVMHAGMMGTGMGEACRSMMNNAGSATSV